MIGYETAHVELDMELRFRNDLQPVSPTLSASPASATGEPGIEAFGHSALKVDGKIFAMTSSCDRFVLALRKSRVDTLFASVAGQNSKRARDGRMKALLKAGPKRARLL